MSLPLPLPLNLLLQLPLDALEQIAFHLAAPDILSLLSSHRLLHEALGNKAAFWRNLLWQREGRGGGSSLLSTTTSPFVCSRHHHDNDLQHEDEDEEDSSNTAKELKEQFLRAAYCQRLSNVHWRTVNATRSSPSEREGHGCCLLGDDDNVLVVTGGFTNDSRIYIKDLNDDSDSSEEEWHAVNPVLLFASGSPPPPHGLFAYGASLTRLNATTALRFGGFTNGGYAGETSLVIVLTITKNENNTDSSGDDYDDNVGRTTRTNDRFQAWWRFFPQKFAVATDNVKIEAVQIPGFPDSMLARAYHSATLLDNRYLYIVGGMKTNRGSVLEPICLDCETWTWIFYDDRHDDRHGATASQITTTTVNNDNNNNGTTTTTTTPSGRHGHSVVWDRCRNRLVLFGGGNGYDLLRSGRDNSEVWEGRFASAAPTLSSPSSSRPTTTPSPVSFLAKIKSCQWRLIHDDQNYYSNTNSTSIGREELNRGAASTSSLDANRLRPAETLNLGRCHAAHHVTRDTVILLFGSGKPSTNTILAYDLQTDSFFRPKLALPFPSVLLPNPRFTFASVFIPRLGCIFVHGGYCTQFSQAIVDMALLNLTPAAAAQLHDDYDRQAAFGRALQFPRSGPVTDQHVLAVHVEPRRRHQHAHPLFHAGQPFVRLQRPLFFPDQDFDTNGDDSDDEE
jgi:hypothetical protein